MDITEAKPTRLSTGRGRKLERMAKEKLKAQDVAVMRHNEADAQQRRRERPKSEGWFDQQKNHEAGRQYERSNFQYERSNSGHTSDRLNPRLDRGAENRLDRSNSGHTSDRLNPRLDRGAENRLDRSNSGHTSDRLNPRLDRGAENRLDRSNLRNDPGSGRFDRSNSRNDRRIAGGRNDRDHVDNHLNSRLDSHRNDREV
jgi:hypothetical protein